MLLVDGAQRHAEFTCLPIVARADDGDILRHAQSGLKDCLDRAQGGGIVVTNDSVGRGLSDSSCFIASHPLESARVSLD